MSCDSFPVLLKFLLLLTWSVVHHGLMIWNHAKHLKGNNHFFLLDPSQFHTTLWLSSVILVASSHQHHPSLWLCCTVVCIKDSQWKGREGLIPLSFRNLRKNHICIYTRNWVLFTKLHGVLWTNQGHASVNHSITSAPNYTVVPISKDQNPLFT